MSGTDPGHIDVPVRVNEPARTKRSAHPGESGGAGRNVDTTKRLFEDLVASMAPGPSSSGSTNMVAWATRSGEPA